MARFYLPGVESDKGKGETKSQATKAIQGDSTQTPGEAENGLVSKPVNKSRMNTQGKPLSPAAVELC